jgi:hypothetical protein
MIGFDYYRTITNNPKLFKKLATAYLAAGFPVHIITAVRKENKQKVKESIKRSKVPYTTLEIVVFNDYTEIPMLKLEAAKRLGVKIMYDDMEETCKLLSEYHITTCQLR